MVFSRIRFFGHKTFFSKGILRKTKYVAAKPTEELKALAPIATAKAKIYVDFMGQEANSGSVNFASRSFNIIWNGDKILWVSVMDYGKCAKCLMESFESNWHYAQKW